jgi:exopolyphosphatase / guanosine-5'-triphosphate,3'-diphosphate pyrophosphatase
MKPHLFTLGKKFFMRTGIIDCGTNTFHLLIVDVDADKNFSIIHKLNLAVKLGEGGIANAVIQPQPFARGLIALKEFKKLLSFYKVEKIKAYGTAALRSASNGNHFLDEAKMIGIDIIVVDGNKEAELIYAGVKHAATLPNCPVIIMDIGGGSVEFIICTNKEILWRQSFEIGAALLLDKFKPSDPITETQLLQIEEYLLQTLKPLFIFAETLTESILDLIGSAGSFETFAEMCLHQFGNPEELQHKKSFDIPLAQYAIIHKQLLHSNVQQRKNMKGIIEMRLDMIVIASILLNVVIQKLSIKTITLSAYALKEGMLYE